MKNSEVEEDEEEKKEKEVPEDQNPSSTAHIQERTEKMSETRDIDTGLSDKERKLMKNGEVEEDEEKKKEKEVQEEQNPSSTNHIQERTEKKSETRDIDTGLSDKERKLTKNSEAKEAEEEMKEKDVLGPGERNPSSTHHIQERINKMSETTEIDTAVSDKEGELMKNSEVKEGKEEMKEKNVPGPGERNPSPTHHIQERTKKMSENGDIDTGLSDEEGVSMKNSEVKEDEEEMKETDVPGPGERNPSSTSQIQERTKKTSESRDIDTGLSDKDGKLMKNSKVKEDEKDENAKNLPEEENPSTEDPADTNVSDKRTVRSSREENGGSRSKKQKLNHFSNGHDHTPSDATPEVESTSYLPIGRDSSERAKQEEQDRASSDEWGSDLDRAIQEIQERAIQEIQDRVDIKERDDEQEEEGRAFIDERGSDNDRAIQEILDTVDTKERDDEQEEKGRAFIDERGSDNDRAIQEIQDRVDIKERYDEQEEQGIASIDDQGFDIDRAIQEIKDIFDMEEEDGELFPDNDWIIELGEIAGNDERDDEFGLRMNNGGTMMNNSEVEEDEEKKPKRLSEEQENVDSPLKRQNPEGNGQTNSHEMPKQADWTVGTFITVDGDSSDESNEEIQSGPAALDESNQDVQGGPAAVDESNQDVLSGSAALDKSNQDGQRGPAAVDESNQDVVSGSAAVNELNAIPNSDILRVIQELDDESFPALYFKSLSHSFFLYEMELSRSNRLLIPVQLAAYYFPFLAAAAHDGGRPHPAEILLLTDLTCQFWHFPVTYYDEERAFIITKRWPEFHDRHKLQPLDMIRFYTPVPQLGPNHFLIESEKQISGIAYDPIQPGEIPEFRTENFLFTLELSPKNIGSERRLLIPEEKVANHFPGVQISESSHDEEILRFTDSQNKDWYMDITRHDSKDYVVMGGWSEYVKEHSLDAEKVINFYKPVQPAHAKHFLIDWVK
ncbi:regulator of (H+)-ATPase in vacuolar membrane [Sarracenia purpurea var. burkii]